MTETEWLATATLTVELREVAVAHLSERKRRLFACACCRRIWDLLDDELRQGVEAAEQLADGQLREQDQARIQKQVEQLTGTGRVQNFHALAVQWAIDCHPHYPLCSSAYSSEARAFALTGAFWASGYKEVVEAEQQHQVRFLRDIIGNPFRSVAIDPLWRTSTVVALAQGIYEERTFDCLPILGDALEDAGCDEAILNHLRQPGSHVRGCWVLDMILGQG
jgi:hypothetical protein